MGTPTKVIVACKGRLQLKYGSKFSKIPALLKKLALADKKRGIQTSVLFIDDAESAKALKLKAQTKTTPKDCKAAVDALYALHAPDYIAILGAQDAFPFQDLVNPTDDEDSLVPSDLPYACEHPYSTDASAFLGPTRVVGRIPDIPEVADLNYLTKVLTVAGDYEHMTADKYSKFFAVSAKVWQGSTKMSLMAAFGQNKGLKLSPAGAPDTGYSTKDFEPLCHFYNCHGALDDFRFWGQKDDKAPIDKVALDASNLNGNVVAGTVVAAECCYGAGMFNPEQVTTDGTTSIANSYLGHGALAFLGSSTVAYGPAVGQGQADYITQFFMINVLRGASSGRALLEARQLFLNRTGPNLDPVDMKTIAQFYLLGDPSVTPIKDVAKTKKKSTTTMRAGATMMATATANTVENRRRNLLIKGLNLAENMAAPRRVEVEATTAKAKSGPVRAGASAKKPQSEKEKSVAAVLKEAGFGNYDVQSLYESESPVRTNNMRAGFAKGMLDRKTQFRTFTKLRQETPDTKAHSDRTLKAPVISRNEILVVKEDSESVLRWRVYQAR